MITNKTETMKAEEARREFVQSLIERVWETGNGDSHECNTRFDDLRNLQGCVSNNLDDAAEKLNSLLDEHYYPKEKYDELLKQKDELMGTLMQLVQSFHNDKLSWEQWCKAEAAIKSINER